MKTRRTFVKTRLFPKKRNPMRRWGVKIPIEDGLPELRTMEVRGILSPEEVRAHYFT